MTLMLIATIGAYCMGSPKLLMSRSQNHEIEVDNVMGIESKVVWITTPI